MRIQENQPRRTLFKGRSTAQIVNHLLPGRPNSKNRHEVLLQEWREGGEEYNIMTGTVSGDLDELIGDGDYKVESGDVVAKIASLHEGQILVLPPEINVNGNKLREILSYRTDTLMGLHSAAVKRKLGFDRFNSKLYSDKEMIEHKLTPELLMETAVNIEYNLRRAGQERKYLTGFTWFGKDNRRRTLSPIRSFEGCELFQYSELAKLAILTTKWDEFKDRLATKTICKQFENQRENAQKFVCQYNLEEQLDQLDISEKDLAFVKNWSPEHHGAILIAPSRYLRGNIQKSDDPEVEKWLNRPEQQLLQMNGIPAVTEETQNDAFHLWTNYDSVPTIDGIYRTGRRDTVNSETLYSPQSILGILLARRGLSKLRKSGRTKYRIPLAPVLFPLPKALEYVDNLRTRCVVYHPDRETEKLQPLGKGTMDLWITHAMIEEGYHGFVTTSPQVYRENCYGRQNLIRVEKS